ncbi:helix-hairpin-helix domain-containing protein [Sporolactobacillus sp. THM19-2]|uniref:helix-hairpin-helix domain-containing protein n=1 Tax=Sporolactobacillus sp. THM19-2 TaxID=2511171 RepID=UPI001020F218|nr:helix-hairpin-helix domain-containing protein [Sporolactobacillus sp. THM19-2]RYL90379.1 competence protein ComEA [Sporolactobacillus sp. THM19-2]
MEKIWRDHKFMIILLIIVACLSLFFAYRHFSGLKAAEALKTQDIFDQTQESKTAEAGRPEQKTPVNEIVVDIKGEVNRPGIYRMKETERVSDAINRAGGLTKKADEEQINLAQKVVDEMVIYIPEKGEKPPEGIPVAPTAPAQAPSSGEESPGQKVNVNTADEQTLQNLPGIGPSKAKAIIQYRQEKGPFKSLEELTEVSGIGEKSLEQIKPSATLH